jgi:3,4-dihydroxy-9,10-secoandrosta-1,3,5(10)-triene-9,17-dione 4,5-dioxygenase
VISEFCYVGFRSPRYQEWESFGPNVLGAELVSGAIDGAVRLRIDEVEYRIAIHPGDRDELAYAGWAAQNEGELRAYVANLRKKGVNVVHGDDELRRERQVPEIYWFVDPFQVRHELTWGKRSMPGLFNSPRGVKSFVTGDQGLGHVVLVVSDLEEAHRFYTDVMGFKYSDEIATSQVKFRFYHINGRHHSLAIVGVPGMVGCNHIMLECSEFDDVGRAQDYCRKNDVDVTLSLGRHTNDRMVSFYVRSPSSFHIEYGYGGFVIDEETWVARTYPTPTLWGHARSGSFLENPPGIMHPIQVALAK